MKICGLEKLSLVDYEGKVCAVVFTGGCNYKCPFCHNSTLALNKAQEILEEDILAYLLQRKKMLDAVCVSGGEPTLWQDLPEFLAKVKEMGFLVKLDTNGTNPQMLQKLINEKLIDYVAMDIKNCFKNYTQTAGVLNANVERVKESLNILKENKILYELRTTLVKEFHTKEDICSMANDLVGAKKIYLQKYNSLDTCIKKNLTAVSKDEALTFADILEKTVNKVGLRGYV